MRFINHHKRKFEVISQYKISRCLICGNCHAAQFDPRYKRRLTSGSMYFRNTQLALLTDFPAPVCNYAGRTHNNKMRCIRIFQRDHRCDCLNSFTKPHLIAQKRAPLMEYILYAPFLISAQLAQQPLRKETFILNFPHQVFRKPIYRIIVSQQAWNNAFQNIKKPYRISFKLFPCLYV